MRLEGTLDAFSLPDIFQLLSFTKKTGALRLTRPAGPAGPAQSGVVQVREGMVTSARADLTRHELGRRLLSTGLVDDEALASAAEELAEDPAASLARLLAEKADLAGEVVTQVAADQIADAVFDLLRWPEGEFSFVVDEPDRDDVGATLPLEDVVTEGKRRLDAWPSIAEMVPAADAVLRLNPAPPAEPTTTPEEWALLATVDGRRPVGDLVALVGRGEFAVVSALAALVTRGLLVVGEAGDDIVVRRHRLLSALEGAPVADEAEPAAPAVAADVPAQPAAADNSADDADRPVAPAPGSAGPVIPARPEPFTSARRPDHPEPAPSLARAAAEGATVTALSSHGSVNGATAMQPEPAPGVVERDPSVNKSLLLRLIAGVRGL
jgi:hypothetical protein